MALDGKILAQARERLAERREENEQEHRRRQARAYAAQPELREVDRQLRTLPAQAIRLTLSGAGGAAAIERLDGQDRTLRQRREALLQRGGFPAGWLDGVVSCPDCGDAGYDRRGRPCACLLRLYRAEQARELSSVMHTEKSDFAEFDLNYYSRETDPRFGFSPREGMEQVLMICRTYAESFGPASGNLLFRGGAGLGKTFLSACIAKAVVARDFSVVYDTAVSAFEAFETEKFSRDSAAGAAAAEKTARMLSCDLMILDDLGTEMTTSFTQSALYTLVNTRLNESRKTILSTNLSQAEVSLRYSGQIVSRIEGEYDELLFLGEDVRAQRKRRRYQ